MDEAVKNAWTTALRSGEYVQGKGTLRRTHQDGSEASYCCLGVLCDLAVQGAFPTDLSCRWDDRGWGNDAFLYSFPDNSGEEVRSQLNRALQEEFGLYSKDCGELMVLNDGLDGADPCPFATIADWIDNNL